MKTALVLFSGSSITFTGKSKNKELAASVDVVSVQSALKSLAQVADNDWLIAVEDEGAVPEMLGFCNDGREDAPIIVKLEDSNAILEFAKTQPVNMLVVLGGSNDTFKLVEEIIQNNPDLALIPVASTGGAAESLYNESLEKYDQSLLNEISYSRLFRKILPQYINDTVSNIL